MGKTIRMRKPPHTPKKSSPENSEWADRLAGAGKKVKKPEDGLDPTLSDPSRLALAHQANSGSPPYSGQPGPPAGPPPPVVKLGRAKDIGSSESQYWPTKTPFPSHTSGRQIHPPGGYKDSDGEVTPYQNQQPDIMNGGQEEWKMATQYNQETGVLESVDGKEAGFIRRHLAKGIMVLVAAVAGVGLTILVGRLLDFKRKVEVT
jgi:hypothetical protein